MVLSSLVTRSARFKKSSALVGLQLPGGQFLLTGFENTVCLSVRFFVLGRVVVSLTPPQWWVQIVLLAEQGSL